MVNELRKTGLDGSPYLDGPSMEFPIYLCSLQRCKGICLLSYFERLRMRVSHEGFIRPIEPIVPSNVGERLESAPELGLVTLSQAFEHLLLRTLDGVELLRRDHEGGGRHECYGVNNDGSLSDIGNKLRGKDVVEACLF